MANQTIKGITIEIGGDVSPLNKALASVQSESKNIQSQLRAVNELLKFDPSNTEAIAEKQRLLAEAAENSRKKLDILRQAQEEVEAAFKRGDMGEAEYRAFQTRVTYAEADVKKAEKAVEQFGEECKESGKDAEGAGNDSEKAGKKAKQSGEDAKSGGSGWETFGNLAKGAGKIAVASVTAIAAGAAATGKAVWNMAQDTASATDKIDKQSQRLGMSRQAYQEWDYILSQNGVSIETMNTAMKSMTTAMADLAAGGKKGQETLAQLGITTDDLKNMKQEEIFEKAIVELQKMPEGYEKARLAQQLFGKQGQEMLPMLNTSKGSISELKDRAHELGLVMSDEAVGAGVKFTDSLDTLKRTFTGVKNNIMAGILPSLTQLTEGFTSLIAGQDGAGEQIKAGIESILQSFKQIMPQLLTAIGAIAEAILGIIPELLPTLVETLLGFLPTLAETALTIIQSIVQSIMQNAQAVVDVIMQILTMAITFITKNLPSFISAGIKIVVSLVQGIAKALPDIIKAIVDMIPELIQAIVDNLPLVIDAGITLLLSLTQGIIDAIPQLLEALPTVIDALLNGILSAIPQLINAGIQLLTSLVAALPTIIQTIVAVIPQIISSIINALMANLPLIIQAGIDLLVALVQALPKIILTIVNAIPQIISGIVNALIGNIDKIILAGVQLFVALIENTPKIIIEIVKAIPEIIGGIIKAIIGFIPKMAECGLNLIKGLWNGIKDAGAWLRDKISGFFGGVVDSIKDFFGIHSPSTLFRDMIGKNLVRGISVGVDVETPNLQEDLEKNMGNITAGLEGTINAENMKLSVSGEDQGQTNLGGIHFHIEHFHNSTEKGIAEITEEAMEAAEEYIRRRGEVFA